MELTEYLVVPGRANLDRLLTGLVNEGLPFRVEPSPNVATVWHVWMPVAGLEVVGELFVTDL